jgi:hypothetical protein
VDAAREGGRKHKAQGAARLGEQTPGSDVQKISILYSRSITGVALIAICDLKLSVSTLVS